VPLCIVCSLLFGDWFSDLFPQTPEKSRVYYKWQKISLHVGHIHIVFQRPGFLAFRRAGEATPVEAVFARPSEAETSRAPHSVAGRNAAEHGEAPGERMIITNLGLEFF
jgi:hypothetical protein